MAKRKQIAAEIRQDADRLQNPANPLPCMLRLAESLVYEKDAAVTEKVEQMANAYVAGLKQLPADQLSAKKDEVKHVNGAFQYLTKFNLVPAEFGPKAEIEKIVKDNKWDKK
jgi:hypothetical protein